MCVRILEYVSFKTRLFFFQALCTVCPDTLKAGRFLSSFYNMSRSNPVISKKYLCKENTFA